MRSLYDTALARADQRAAILAQIAEADQQYIMPLATDVATAKIKFGERVAKVMHLADATDSGVPVRQAKLARFREKLISDMEALGLASVEQTEFLTPVQTKLNELDEFARQHAEIIGLYQELEALLANNMKTRKRLELAEPLQKHLEDLLRSRCWCPIDPDILANQSRMDKTLAVLRAAVTAADTGNSVGVLVRGNVAPLLLREESDACNAYIQQQNPNLQTYLFSSRYVSQQLSSHMRLAEQEGGKVYTDHYMNYALYYLLLRLFELLKHLAEANRMRQFFAHDYAAVLADSELLLQTAQAFTDDNALVMMQQDAARLNKKIRELPYYQRACVEDHFYFDERCLLEKVTSLEEAIQKLYDFQKQAAEKGVDNTGKVSILMTDAARAALYIIGETIRTPVVPEHYKAIKTDVSFQQAQRDKIKLQAIGRKLMAHRAMQGILNERNEGGHYVRNVDGAGVREAISPHDIYDLCRGLDKFAMLCATVRDEAAAGTSTEPTAEPAPMAVSGLKPSAPPLAAAGAGGDALTPAR